MNLPKVEVECTNNGMVKVADVLEQTRKFIKVAFEGTDVGIVLHYDQKKRIYVGRFKNLEFVTTGV